MRTRSMTKWQQLLVLLFLAPFCLRAQGTSASITGTLRDPSGAIVGNSTVKALSAESGVSWSAVSNQSGIYNLLALPPGKYTVSVEAAGFKRVTTNEITLDVNQVARVDFALEVGAVSDTVTVSGVAPVLQTESTQLGTLVSATTTVNLPLNGRNFSQLTLLAPGVVTYDVTSYTDGSRNSSGGRPLVNGNRAQDNNFRLDGFDSNESEDNLIAYYPSVDAIAEFKLITTNAPAEFGNAMGGIVNTTLKSGTNEYHGDLFDFLRNDKMDSNSWFGNATHQPRPHFSQNIFGGVIGGPIRKNKLFFFTDYQGWRRGKGVTSAVRTVVPTAWRGGNFGSDSSQLYNPFTQTAVTSSTGAVTYVRMPFAGNQIPASLINPVASKLFSYPAFYPLPLTSANANNWNGAGRQGVTDNQGDIKLDYKISDKDSLSGRFSTGSRESDTVDAERINPQAPEITVTHSAGIAWTRIISPNLLNEARVGFNRFYDTTLVADTGKIGNFADTVGIPNINIVGPGFPQITFSDASTIGNSGGQSRVADNTFQYEDAVTFSRGRHIFKTGLEILRYQENRFVGSRGVYGAFDFNGSYTQQIGTSNTGSGVADFLLGYPDNEGRAGGAPWGQRQIRYGGFFQDDWKVKNNITLNLGLRYEYVTPLVEVFNRQTNFNVNTGAELFAGLNGNSRALYKDSKDGFQPRFGLSWNPTQFHHDLVVRMAYGILNYMESTGTNRKLPVNPPFFTDYFVQYDQRFLGNSITQGLPIVTESNTQTAPISGSLRVFPPLVKPALVQQWNFTLEYRLPSDIALSVGYVGEDATHVMEADRYYSQAVIGTAPLQTRRLDYAVLPGATEIVVTDPRGRMNYQSFQMSLQKRFSRGVEFTSSYTWSHGMADNAGYYGTSVTSTASPQNYENLKAEWGPSAMDIRHNFVSSVNYDLPFGKGKSFMTNAPGVVNAIFGGWRLSAVVTIRSGLPLTIEESPDTSNTGSSGPRPNALFNAILGSGQRSPAEWFNTAAFARQAPNTFGNAGTGTVRMPGLRDLDLALAKNIPIGERRHLEFRAESFNLTDTPFFTGVGNTLGTSTFGTLTAAQNERETQLGLKFYF